MSVHTYDGKSEQGLSLHVSQTSVPPDQQLESLIDRYRGYIAQIVSRLAPKHLGVLTSEIEQETTIRLWRSLRNEREIRNFQSYVYRVAATAALDAIRQIKERREEPLVQEHIAGLSESPFLPGSRAVSPEDAMWRKRLLHRIRDIVEQLPPNRRRAVKFHLQGFTSEEIARACGWSEPKARNLTYRGLEDLRGMLRDARIDHAD
jgi:RNA polymerase sigma factor (sigma-70 family)